MSRTPRRSPAEGATGSVYERALGEAFSALRPQLQVYFGSIPDGHVGVGVGQYEEAGLRCRVLRPVFAVLGRWQVAFPEHGADVPFTVRNARGSDGALTAERTFAFPTGVRAMVDSLRVVDGRLIDRIGRDGRIEVELSPSVTDGGLTMRSRKLALRIGGLRMPLPPVARVILREHALPGAAEIQRVDVRIVVPLLGEVYGYRGTFTYALRPVEQP